MGRLWKPSPRDLCQKESGGTGQSGGESRRADLGQGGGACDGSEKDTPRGLTQPGGAAPLARWLSNKPARLGVRKIPASPILTTPPAGIALQWLSRFPVRHPPAPPIGYEALSRAPCVAAPAGWSLGCGGALE